MADAHEAAALCAAAVSDRVVDCEETWRERPRLRSRRAARRSSSGVAHATLSVPILER